ncbi:BTB/POZ domain-containing protein KCTD11 [Diceros bicornis minor]|uniref:BTB/POZ domain-containing protein KCTD11 n=1 Tax=Diceros bicornis minor TaxID=77932 RepID=A0A7J7E8U3_DICBM|nr:BTB/POZ domain-containing protein KCTD11 [Diceros bicornis minor]KAF5911816.1 hypothetical protein HPG69_015794 [Diceros bicornis minor]
MRLDRNLPSFPSGYPLLFSSVLSTFRAFLCPETIPHYQGSWGEPQILLPCSPTCASNTASLNLTTQFCTYPGSSAFSSLSVSPILPKISPPPVPSSTPSFGGPVTLNVGGTLYSTTLETLTRFPDSMLGAMFRAGTPIPPNLNTQGGGHYFIDRDGKAFRHILNFLRLGRLDLPRGYGETALLRAEADFYQIRPLLDALRELEASRGAPAPTAALLHADVDASPRQVHFSARRGPHHYELSSVQVDTFRANLFCTDPECLGAMRARFGVANEDRAEGGPHFHLEWAPRPAELPEVEYRRLGLQPLWTGGPGERREVVGTPAFLEEVLRVALEHGFRLDSVFPDPEDLLNSRSLRFVRH